MFLKYLHKVARKILKIGDASSVSVYMTAVLATGFKIFILMASLLR